LATLAAALWAADVVYRYAYLANVAYPKTCRIKALPARVICLTFPKVHVGVAVAEGACAPCGGRQRTLLALRVRWGASAGAPAP
jgi:hypothetical protein